MLQDMMSTFEADVTEALIPFVDKTFRTIPDRDHRAMAGLSMGGMQTYHITLSHLDLFSYIAGFRRRSQRRCTYSGWVSARPNPSACATASGSCTPC